MDENIEYRIVDGKRLLKFTALAGLSPEEALECGRTLVYEQSVDEAERCLKDVTGRNRRGLFFKKAINDSDSNLLQYHAEELMTILGRLGHDEALREKANACLGKILGYVTRYSTSPVALGRHA